MIIKQLNLISFGKFTNKIIDFKDGINVLYGENEAGKSTILSFIQFMFYGSTTKKSNIAENIKLKFMPWDADIIEGELIYNNDGIDYIIHRKAGKRSTVDVINKNTGESLGSEISKNIGIHLFNLSEDAFVKTLFISQNGISTSPDKDGIIVKRLSSLGSENDEGGSYTKVKKELEEEILNLSSPRRSGAIIPKLHEEIEELTDELEEIKANIKAKESAKENYTKIAERTESLQKEKLALENQLEDIEKAEMAESYIKAEEEYKKVKTEFDRISEKHASIDLSAYPDFDCIDDDVVNKIMADDTEDINKLGSAQVFATEKAKSAKRISIASAIGLVICIALGFIYPASFGVAVIFVAILVYGIISSKSQMKKVSEIDEEIASKKAGKQDILSQYGFASKTDFLNMRSQYTQKRSQKSELESSLVFLANQVKSKQENVDKLKLTICAKYDNLENVLNIFSKYDNIGNKETVKAKLNLVLTELNNLISEAAVAKHLLGNEDELSQRYLNVTEKIAEKEKQLSEKSKRLEILKKALDILDVSFDEIKNNFAPKLAKNASDIFSRITGEKYQNLLINHDFDTRVDSGKGFYELPYFSGGTIDQLYFSVRFGIIETIKDKDASYPVFLDDIFCQCDTQRLNKAIEFLSTLADTTQVVFSTCHEREKGIFENTKNVNIINL